MSQIIPAILTSNEEDYLEKLHKAEHVSDIIQIDVVDGIFANNITIGVDIIKKYPSTSMLEIQLMVINLKEFVLDLVRVDHVLRIIVPFETKSWLEDSIYEIKKHNKQVGLSLNPLTTVDSAQSLFSQIDMLLLLGVNPGFGGQTFQDIVIEKIKQTKKIAPGIAIEVDGGVNFKTAKIISTAGADFLAANSVIFEASDFRGAYDSLAKIVANPQ